MEWASSLGEGGTEASGNPRQGRWLRLSSADCRGIYSEASQPVSEPHLSTRGGSCPVFWGGGSHTSFSYRLLLETTWYHSDFYIFPFKKLSRLCEAVKRLAQILIWTHKLTLSASSCYVDWWVTWISFSFHFLRWGWWWGAACGWRGGVGEIHC